MEIPLPSGGLAYGRVRNDAGLALYRSRSRQRGSPPIGSRDYEFVVGVYDEVLTDGKWPAVGEDPPRTEDDGWPPPTAVRDVISGAMRVYERGQMRPATEEEVAGLEPAAVWDRQHIVARLVGQTLQA